MRTTLNIDDDVLATVQFLARQEAKTAGAVLSDLARRGLESAEADASHVGSAVSSRLAKTLTSFGVVPYAGSPSRSVTTRLVDTLRDAEGV